MARAHLSFHSSFKTLMFRLTRPCKNTEQLCFNLVLCNVLFSRITTEKSSTYWTTSVKKEHSIWPRLGGAVSATSDTRSSEITNKSFLTQRLHWDQHEDKLQGKFTSWQLRKYSLKRGQMIHVLQDNAPLILVYTKKAVCVKGTQWNNSKYMFNSMPTCKHLSLFTSTL